MYSNDKNDKDQTNSKSDPKVDVKPSEVTDKKDVIEDKEEANKTV